MQAPSIISRSKMLGLVSPSSRIEGAVGLKPRNEAALTQFISSVTTKGSAEFHHYLAHGQFASRFGPSASTIAAVRSALRRDGLQVSSVSSNGLLVTFSGTVGKVESTFHTRIANFRLPNGTVGHATTSAVRLPASIAADVNVVTGLDDLVHASPAGIMRATKSAASQHPAAKAPQLTSVPGAPNACQAASADAAAYGGLTDNQIANAYGAFGLYRQGDTGVGQSIAVYELEPFSRSDVATFDRCYFGSAGATAMAGRLHVVRVDGGQPAGPGSGEAILDVEDVSAMAPGANIDVYEAPNTTFGGLDEYNQIIALDSDKIVTSSWGLCEQAVQQGEPGVQQEENALFQEAAAQGQSVFAAAGDTGSNDCNAFRTPQPVPPILSVDDPGSQPYVTSVGGTTIDNATQPPLEHVWNDGAEWGAGGGGISSSWTMPSWQYSSRVPGIEQSNSVYSAATAIEGDSFCDGGSNSASPEGYFAGAPCREVPDVSAQADEFTGAVTIYSAAFGPGAAGWITIGGTSSATPIWAAMLALVNASATCTTDGESTGVGFVSPLLYAVASNASAYAASFNDITTGNNDIYNLAGGLVYPATKGYDMASGLGSPQLSGPKGQDGLAYYLCSYGVAATRPTVTGLDPQTLLVDPSSSPQTVSVTGTGFEDQSGTAQVASVWVNNVLIPAAGAPPGSPSPLASFTVNSSTSLTLDLPPGFFNSVFSNSGGSDGAGPAAVVVTLADGETSAVNPGSVLDVVDNLGSTPVPAVTGVSTYGGPQSGLNTVTVLGSGFAEGDTVGFGGVSSPSVTYVSPYKLLVEVPAYNSASTYCATSPQLNAATDVCQAQVVVTDPTGTYHSKTYAINKPYEGTIAYDPNGVLVPPPGCDCEVAPAPSEYDYFPTPQITSLSTSQGSFAYGSEQGGTTMTITGTGLDSFGLSKLFVGDPTQESSLDYNISFESGTEIQVSLPPLPSLTVDSVQLPVSIVTLGGTSNSSPATYAGIPDVASVSPSAAPDTGGTNVTVTGEGFDDALYGVFADTLTPYSIGTSYDLNIASDTQLSMPSPAQNPALVDVLLCTASGCSTSPADQMILYPPGTPQVTGASPRSGPSHGGTAVTISGHNLGCVTAVYFGQVLAESFTNAQAILDCGSTNAIVAQAPAERAGITVPIRIATVESTVTGTGLTRVVRAASFTYRPSSPSAPSVEAKAGPSSVSFSWKPPRIDGGSPVTFYVVRAWAKGLPARVAVLPSTSRSWHFSGLYWGAQWTISVCAHNRYGAGVMALVHVRPDRPKH